MEVSSSHGLNGQHQALRGLRTESSSLKLQLTAKVLAQSIPEIIVSKLTCYYIYFS